MRSTFFKKRSPIGLDLGSHSFKAVQLASTARGWELASSVSLERTTPGAPLTASEVRRLKDVLDRRQFAGRDVVVAVPASSLLTAILELPARAPGLPLEQIAVAEFARVHKQEAALLTMSAWELPAPARASKATYMLAFGAPSAQLESHIDLIESEGLNVVAMEEPNSAAARGSLHLSGPQMGLMAAIDLGWHSASLTIIKDNCVVYTRRLGDAALKRLIDAATEAAEGEREHVENEIWRVGFSRSSDSNLHNLDVLDVLESHMTGVLKEIQRALSYTAHQYPDAHVSRAVLIGGGAIIPGIAERFASALGVGTSLVATPRSADAAVELPPPMISALGLALWTGGAR